MYKYNRYNRPETQSYLQRVVDSHINFQGITGKYINREVALNTVYKSPEHVLYKQFKDLPLYIEDGKPTSTDMGIGVDLFTITDTFTVYISRKHWSGLSSEFGQTPDSGDLLYLPPPMDRMIEINKVFTQHNFYSFGSTYTYKLNCTLFEYANEEFSDDILTAVDSINDLVKDGGEIDGILDTLDISKEANDDVDNFEPSSDNIDIQIDSNWNAYDGARK